MEGIKDIPRLYTGIAEWMSCMSILLICRRRLRTDLFVFISVIMLVVQCGFLIITDDMPANILWILCMVCAAAFMYGFLLICGNFSPVSAGYCFAAAFLEAEFAASLEWQLHVWFFSGSEYRGIPSLILLLAVYGGVFGLLFFLVKTQLTEDYLDGITWKEVLSANLITLIAFVFSNLSFALDRSPFSGKVIEDIYNIRTLVDLGGLAILYAFQSRISELMAAAEVEAVRRVLKSQYEQYRNYQESEEMLHVLQHDLKHQIDGLRAETDLDRRAEWLDAIEEELAKWWVPQKTGNPVLDTILEAKLRLCRNRKIRLTCVADGALLSGMHVTDICNIFGNALDNAMESVIQIPEEEKRLVHVSIASQKNFIFIQVTNTCESEVREGEEGTLLTTKPDKAHHGYGMKGIRYAVEKYGGTVSHHIENGWFELRILIPMSLSTYGQVQAG